MRQNLRTAAAAAAGGRPPGNHQLKIEQLFVGQRLAGPGRRFVRIGKVQLGNGIPFIRIAVVAAQAFGELGVDVAAIGIQGVLYRFAHNRLIEFAGERIHRQNRAEFRVVRGVGFGFKTGRLQLTETIGKLSVEIKLLAHL